MRCWLLLIAACVLCGCPDESLSPAPTPDAGSGVTSGTGAGPGPEASSPPSRLDRPADLPRPPGSRLPDDLKPPVR